jgi:polysaccharide export outer membrane protein
MRLRSRPFIPAALLLLIAGCASEGADLPPMPTSATAALKNYTLGPGDRLQIVLFGAGAALQNQNQNVGMDIRLESTISDDGTVGVPEIGEMEATGLTIPQLKEKIRTKLADGYLAAPNVGVEIMTYRPFYIIGEVNHPGSYAYANASNVLSAVALAGGYSDRAQQKFAIVQRMQDGQPVSRRAERTTPILPGDIIDIPERYF